MRIPIPENIITMAPTRAKANATANAPKAKKGQSQSAKKPPPQQQAQDKASSATASLSSSSGSSVSTKGSTMSPGTKKTTKATKPSFSPSKTLIKQSLGDGEMGSDSKKEEFSLEDFDMKAGKPTVGSCSTTAGRFWGKQKQLRRENLTPVFFCFQ